MAFAAPEPRVTLRLALVIAALAAVRALSAIVVSQPGYTDAYYYLNVAERLARGDGLTADFIWSFIEAPRLEPLPVASHRFWMPLPTVLQSVGVALAGDVAGTFRAAQAATIAVSLAIPAVAYSAARSLGARERAALVAAAVAGLGGAFAPGWVSVDSFAPAAVLGTLFFMAYMRAAGGDVRAGALAGLLVGVLYLARAEAAFFGIALLVLRSRAGLTGAAVALAIGLVWQARQLALGMPADLLARTSFLDRYEDFFALAPPTLDAHVAAWPAPLLANVQALTTNALTLAFAFALVLVPGLVAGARSHWRRADVRAYALLLALVYAVLSLAFTLHSTRGAFFHALAAFFPFGVALAVVGSRPLLARMRAPALPAVAATAVIAGVAALSVVSVASWDAAFNVPYRARLAALDRLPPGPFLAIDAAAWRWISGRPVIVTPADGPSVACTVARAYGARSLVLEPAHFSAYDALYRSAESHSWLGAAEGGDIRVHRVTGACDTAP